MNEHLTKALHDLEFARESLGLAREAAKSSALRLALAHIERYIGKAARDVERLKAKGEG